MNDTWGFKENGDNWRLPQALICQLFEVLSRSGNYLLNVGPTADGVNPQPSVDRLGRWVHGSAPMAMPSTVRAEPFPCRFSWGSMTSKTGESVSWDCGLARERELWVKRIF